MGLMEGKRGLIFGVANDRSIAWACAQAFHRAGAELGFTYFGEALERRVRPLAEGIGSNFIEPCDVGNDDDITRVFARWRERYDGMDFLLHAVAYAHKEDLEGHYVDTSRRGFQVALDVSAYSFTALARAALPCMQERGGSLVTLTYYGSEKAVPRYNVMGVAKAALEAGVRYLASDLGPHNIRVNAVSAGPVLTLAAAGIPGFRGMLKASAERSPLLRNIDAREIAGAALFLCSDLASGITGDILFVDAGYHVMGM